MQSTNQLIKFTASAGGIGYLPAPGTMASAIALIIWYLLKPDIITSLLIIFITIAIGIYVSGVMERSLGKDPSVVVIDEFAGMFVSLFMLELSWLNLFLAFSLFRLLDIFKPLGIKRFESINGGWGIMLDDFIAGIYTLCLMFIYQNGL
ncbi:MAG: phosphatidylglycerophosphatase A [Calditrichaeota bacterium]|nr:phosphatidylglycerophosphatase A [Calditrichota bacterium]